ncbi:MAG: hypothetical protein HY077_07080 [Elusimicrobia bacterium]|nr:hypothetical protein [Elusimicrobiota bacterium]
MKKIIATSLAAALIILSPGLPCYEVLASEAEGPTGKGNPTGPLIVPKVENLAIPPAGISNTGVGGTEIRTGVDVNQAGATEVNPAPVAPGGAEAGLIASASLGAPQSQIAGPQVAAVVPANAAVGGSIEKPVAAAATKDAGSRKDSNSVLAGVSDGETAKTLADTKTDKTGVLAWIFERIRRKGAKTMADEVGGDEKPNASGLSPAAAKEAAPEAVVPAPAPSAPAKKTAWDKVKSILDFSQYNKTQKAYLIGQIVFIVGIAIYMTSMPLLVSALTGSTAFTGTVRMVHYVTLGVASLVSGEIVKRNGMKGVLTTAGRTRAAIFGAIGVLAIALGTGMPTALFLTLVGLNALVVAHNHLVDIDAGGAAKVFPDKAQRQQAFYQFLFARYGALLVVPWVFGFFADRLDIFFGVGTGAKTGMILLAAALATAAWLYGKMEIAGEAVVPGTGRTLKGVLASFGRALKKLPSVAGLTLKAAVLASVGRLGTLLSPKGGAAWNYFEGMRVRGHEAAAESVVLHLLFDTPGRIKRTASAIWHNGKVRIRVIMSMAEQFLEDALFFVVMPTFAVDILGQHNMGNGLVLSATYLGGLLASKVLMKYAGKFEKKHGEYKLIAGLSVLASLAFIPSIGLWAVPSIFVALPLVLLMKLMLAPIQAKMQSLLQTAIDEDPKAKAEEENIWSLITTPEVVAAGLGGLFFEKLFEHSQPGGFLYHAVGANGPMKVVTIALMAFAALYLGSLPFLKRQVDKPTRTVHPSPEGKEAEAFVKLTNNLKKMGLPPYTTETVEGPADQRRPTVGILAPASVYKIAIAQEGARQSEGDVHLILDRSWLIEENSHDGGTVWYMKKGLTFKGGKPVIAEYKDPRRIRYRANFYTDGANGRNDGVVYEKGDTPMSSSVQLEKTTNDKLLTRMMLAARGVGVPATLAFVMAAHSLAGSPSAQAMQVVTMPEDRVQVHSGIERFLESYTGDEVVVKPSGPNFHSGIGVAIFRREQVKEMVDHALALKNDPLMSMDGVVLVEQRITPPALYFRTKDYSGSGSFSYLEGKQVTLDALAPAELATAQPWERKDWNFRVLAARAPWGKGVGKGMFARAGTWGKPTNGEAKDPRDSAAIMPTEEVVRQLRLQHGLLKTDAEAKTFAAEFERIGADALNAISKNEENRVREQGEGAQAQTDYIGLDVMVEFHNGKPVPYIIEVNDHDSGGQWQLDEFYPDRAGEHSRAWMATALARARRDAMRGQRMVLVGAGYANKKFFLERAKQLGLEVVLVDKGLTGFAKFKDVIRVALGRPSQDNWAKDLVSEFIAVDTTKPDEALAKAQKKLQRSIRKNGKLGGITTYWEDDIVLTARVAQAMNLPYFSVHTAETARNKPAARDAMEAAGVDRVAHRVIRSRTAMEEAVNDPNFPFPAVLKPAKGAEAQFTGVVERDEALRIYDQNNADIAASHDTIFEQGREFVLEEYLTGHEWDANIGMQDGKMIYGSITDNTPVRDDQKTLKPGEERQLNMKSTGAFLPSVQLSKQEQREALEFAASAARALGVKDGALHIEGKTGPRGPRLLEVNLRPGGSYVVHWNNAVTGIDEAEMLYALALGVPAVAYQSPDPLAHLAGVFVFSDREGKVSYIGLSPEAQAAGLQALFEKKPGYIVDFKDNDRVAFLHASGASTEEALRKLGEDPHKNIALEIGIPDELGQPQGRWAALLKAYNELRARFTRRAPK